MARQTKRIGRILSVDALRGGAILTIIGADGMARALEEIGEGGEHVGAIVARFLGKQFSHASWEGFHFYDLIFPLFLFTVGLSIPLSLMNARGVEDRIPAFGRVVRRTVLLFLLGIIYYWNWGATWSLTWPEIRLAGVLQRIALCYFFAAILFLYLSPRALWICTCLLTVGYAVMLEVVLAPGSRLGPYDAEMNLAVWIDSHWLPGKKHYGNWDPEGLVTTLPAIASCLIGVVAGNVLLSPNITPLTKSRLLASAGMVMLAVGYAASWWVPIIKNLWTASYVLVAGGWSLVFFSIAYHWMDVAGRIRWASVFVWVGANAILLYVLDRFVDFDRLVLKLIDDDVVNALDHSGGTGTSRLMANAAGLILAVVLARALYLRKVFLRL